MTESTKERRFDLMCKALEMESDSQMVKTIVEHIANIDIEDIQETKGSFEIFAKPTGITGKRLNNLQELFTIQEIGIYGDAEVPDENVYLHMIIYISEF